MSSSCNEVRGPDNGSSGSTSSSLLARVQANDTQAWYRLSDLFGPLVYHWCRKSGLPREDAADTVQEVFRSVATGIAHFQKHSEDHSFRRWLWTITQNKVRDYLRVSRNQPRAAGGTDAYTHLLNLPDQLEDSEIGMSAAGAASILLHRALQTIQGQFEDRTWQAFLLATFTDRSAVEIGAELGMTANAVRLAKGRVLHRLRAEIGDLPSARHV
jgi:RNA polymerase sigma-70 factor (ECF subfamily)